MPLHNLGDGCYKWGDSGTKYCGEGARQKALKQMRAEYYNGYKGKGAVEDIVETLTDEEFNEWMGDTNIPLIARVELNRAKAEKKPFKVYNPEQYNAERMKDLETPVNTPDTNADVVKAEKGDKKKKKDGDELMDGEMKDIL